jgi:hypothetical protein
MESQKARECDGALVCVAVRKVDGVPTSGCLQVGIDMRSNLPGGTTSDRAALPPITSNIHIQPYNHHYYVFAPPF